jgi:hypothetical protein
MLAGIVFPFMYVFYARIVNAFIDIERLKENKKFDLSYLKSLNNHSIQLEIRPSSTNIRKSF